jgi:glycosyltransferase involved in cell wall biosynthesis
VARVLIFHGYLLRGTGSNIYNASLAAALVRLGHEVHLFCQEPHPESVGFVDAVGDWTGEGLVVTSLRSPVRCTVYRPPIGRTLPVYVADTYEGFDAIEFPLLSDEQIEAYVEANLHAFAEVADTIEPDCVLANHEVMGPVIARRALGERFAYAVKVHGSALEYTVRPNRERFGPWMLEGLRGAACILAGSRHTAESLWDVAGDPDLRARTRLGPPGVDSEAFRPCEPAAAARRLDALAQRLDDAAPAAWGGDRGAAAALRAADPEHELLVAFVGKLIVAKGVDLLVAAWPLVHRRAPSARLLIAGFGAFRDGLEQLLAALAAGDLERARELARRGRELEGGAGPLKLLTAFLDGLDGSSADAYARACAPACGRVHLTGRLEHADLPDLLCGCAAQVVPSTFPESFGMVAVEGAACGALPISAAHSGLAEVTAALAPALEPELRRLLAFEAGPDAVRELADRLAGVLELDAATRGRAALALSERARRRFGWDEVARAVLAAGAGRLEGLEEVPGQAKIAST